MSSKEVGIEEARKVLGDLVTQVAQNGTDVILTRRGLPVARIAPLEAPMTYTYTIEASDDGEVWQPVTGGTEAADDPIEDYAQAVIDNWLDDKRANGETTDGWRVRVWHGSEQAAHADYTLEASMTETAYLISAVAGDIVPGTELADPDIDIDAQALLDRPEVAAFCEEQGYGVDNPDEVMYLLRESEPGTIPAGFPYIEIQVPVAN